jgi:hypothetical protein
MPGFELEAEVVCPADAKTKAMETALDLVLSKKLSRVLDAAKRGAFKRLTGIHLSRTNVLQASAMFQRSFSPERRQGSIAHKIGHSALHLSSYK